MTVQQLTEEHRVASTIGDAAEHRLMQLLQLRNGVAERQAPLGGRALAQVGRMPQAGVAPACDAGTHKNIIYDKLKCTCSSLSPFTTASFASGERACLIHVMTANNIMHELTVPHQSRPVKGGRVHKSRTLGSSRTPRRSRGRTRGR